MMQEPVYKTPIGDVDDLKRRLIVVTGVVRCAVQQMVIDDAVDQWRKRLRCCVKANGRHFEHSL